MLDAQKRAELDQAMASIAETLPPMWMALYKGSRNAGFDQVQSMDLLKAYILGQSAGKIVPNDGIGPEG